MRKGSNVVIKNKRATFEYEILETFSCGVVLQGTEIKSIRNGKAAINDSYCTFLGKELWIKNLHIAVYEFGTYANHDPLRERKLLLKKIELRKLQKRVQEKGLTIIPLKMYINDKGLAKIDIALCKGKKIYDKRESLKQKDLQRSMQRHEE